MLRSILAHSTAFLLALCMGAAAEGRIGLVLPDRETTTRIADQMEAGATHAADLAGVELVRETDPCTAQGGEALARRLVRQSVSIVVGFVCTEAIEAALPVLAGAGIATITPAVRTDALTDRRERTGWLIYRLAPRADAERDAVAAILTRRWRDVLFAIVDDGTIYGRELAEALRFAAEQAGLQPVFFDTFRPQLDNQIGLVGRLRRAGATHVFVGGEREDIAIMARDAAGLDYDLTIATGEALRAAPGEVPLADGVLMIAIPEWERLADPETVAALRVAGIQPDGYTLPTHAAIEIAAGALQQAGGARTELNAILQDGPFETVLGPLRFDPRGDLDRDLYRLLRHQGGTFIEVE